MPTDTIPHLFIRQAATRAQRPLFFAKQQGSYIPITWGEAKADVDALGCYLLSQGVQPGNRVLLLSENRPEWGIADLAIQSIGAWTVPIYPSLTEADLLTIATDCQPSLCIASTMEQLTKCRAIQTQVSSIRLVISLETLLEAAAGTITWSSALQQGRATASSLHSLLEDRRAHLQPDDTATIIYTSGTTGEPKGVMLSHRNFLSNVEGCLNVIPISADDLHLSFLPLSHVFERMAGWYLMLTVGASVAYAENMDTIPENMREIRPTIMLGVPRFFEKLFTGIQEHAQQLPPLKRSLVQWAFAVGRKSLPYRLRQTALPRSLAIQYALARRLVFTPLHAQLGGRLRFFVSGGAPLAKEIGEFFYSIGVTILEGYGLTETSPVITVNRFPIPRFGSVGRLIDGVEVRIAEDGEILTRGPHVMRGYYQKPQETTEALTDGWFRTGDIGHLDPEGYLSITDRKKDLIKTAGGKFVAPQKLENLFVTDPSISQAFVYGDKAPYCVALIVPRREPLLAYARQQGIQETSLKELASNPTVMTWYWDRIQTLQQPLATFEQVKKIALLDHEFSQTSGELTPTLKTKRNIVAQRYASLLQHLYEP